MVFVWTLALQAYDHQLISFEESPDVRVYDHDCP